MDRLVRAVGVGAVGLERAAGLGAGRAGGKGAPALSPFLAMSLPLAAHHVIAVTEAHAAHVVAAAAHERAAAGTAAAALPFPVPAGPARPPLAPQIGPNGSNAHRLRVVFLAAHFEPGRPAAPFPPRGGTRTRRGGRASARAPVTSA